MSGLELIVLALPLIKVIAKHVGEIAVRKYAGASAETQGKHDIDTFCNMIEKMVEKLSDLKHDLECKKSDGRKVTNTDITDITTLQNDLKTTWLQLVRRFRIPKDRIHTVERLKEQLQHVLSNGKSRPFVLRGDIEPRICNGVNLMLFKIGEVDCQSVFRAVPKNKTMAIWYIELLNFALYII